MGKSIALFGTSADPPTIGHKKILEELSNIYAFFLDCYLHNKWYEHIFWIILLIFSHVQW